MNAFVSRAAIFSALFLFLASCTGKSSLFDPGQTGAITLSASATATSQAPGAPAFTTSPQSFTSGTVNLTQGATSLNVPLSIVSGTATATIPNLTPGVWVLTVNFYDNNNFLTFTGSKNVTVTAGQTANTALVLTPTSGNISVTLNLPDANLILWNTLGSLAEMNSGKVGPLVELNSGASPSFAAGKFGNGLITSGAQIARIGGAFPAARGTIEFWMKPNWSSGSGIHYRLVDSPTTTFNIACESDGVLVYLRIFDQLMSAPESSVVITAGAWVHVAFSWDQAGLDATGETIRLYLNGVKTLAFFNPINSHLVTNDPLMVCAWGYNAGGFDVGSVVDNLKIYAYGKINFADRNVE